MDEKKEESKSSLSELLDAEKSPYTSRQQQQQRTPTADRSSEALNGNNNNTSDGVSKVEQSWFLVENRIDEVAFTFFQSMITEHPELLSLFPFAEEGSNDDSSTIALLKRNERVQAHVRAHAIAVLRVLGSCVAGLTSIEDLVPKLRHIGKTHRQVGVHDLQYELMFPHLVKTIRDCVGRNNWDQETEDAWEQAFASITDLIKRPSTRLETEPLEGWGMALAIACLYFMIVTPFRLAGFSSGHVYWEKCFGVLELIAALFLAADLFVDVLQSKLKFKRIPTETSTQENGWLSSIKRELTRQRMFALRSLQSCQMERWVPWPGNDIKVLLSFPLQYLYRPRPGIGLHWSHLIGLIRVSTAARVMHFLQCAENNALFEQRLDESRQIQVRVSKLLFKLCYIMHLAACLWCIVARFELGADADEATPSSFFPNTDILHGSDNMLNSYIRSVHWAFVNLAGIGDVDSTPVTTLECFLTITVHVCGAIFYAIVTGNVISMLEEASERDNKIGVDIAKLTSLMDSARVSTVSKGRIMKGFMMRNVLTKANSAASERINEGLDLNDDVLSTLPNYLQKEVAIYARAELIRRRDRSFFHCSNGFLVALSSSLSRTRTLLTGDYLMERGEKYEKEFVMIQSGSLQLRHDQHTIKTLERGDVVGKGWLLNTNSPTAEDGVFEYTDWCYSDGKAGLSIRALSPCTLLTGLTSAEEIQQLEHAYKADFDLLRDEIQESRKTRAQKHWSGVKGVARAVGRFKNNARTNATTRSENQPTTTSEETDDGNEKSKTV